MKTENNTKTPTTTAKELVLDILYNFKFEELSFSNHAIVSKSGHIATFWVHEWPTAYLGDKYKDVAVYKVKGMDEDGEEILEQMTKGQLPTDVTLYSDDEIIKVVTRNDEEEAVRYFIVLYTNPEERTIAIIDRVKGKMIKDFDTLRELAD